MPARDDVGDADAALVAGEPPPSRSQRLSRERVVEAALAHIDANGLGGLSMRRLGSDLGVEAMALYRHVAGKEELLDAIVEHLMATMWADEEILQAAGPRLAGLPPAPGPRRTTRRAGPPEGVPPGRLTAHRGAVAPPAPAQPGLGRGLPARPHRRGLHRGGRGGGLPRLHQLPARAPAARGLDPRRRRRPPRRARARRARPVRAGAVPTRYAACVPACPTTGPRWSSRSPWSRSSTG